MTTTAPSARRWCCFRVGDDCFAIDTVDVVEVLRSGRSTRVPLAAAGVLGLVQLRGRIVPVIDPATCLGIGRRGAIEQGTLLVTAIGDDWYGFSVDEMLDVLEIPPERVEYPTTKCGPAFRGTYAADSRLVHLLAPEHLIDSLVRPAVHQAIPGGGSHGSV
jgi:purine-binding chemotaxis protein CheW